MKTATIDNTKQWTVDDFLQLEESNLPCELINGELFMSPAPSLLHQIVTGNLYEILKAYSRKNGGFTGPSPLDVFLDQKNVFQPDVLYIQKENLSKLIDKGINGAPDLTVEVISPSNIFKDRNQKMRLYQKFGVKEYWIIDPQNKTIEIYDFSAGENPVLYLAEEGTVTSRLLPGLSFNFADLFIP
jgi:Uma2 family endonuclease